MIVVDSSVWIDYFTGTDTPEADHLDSLLGRELIVIGDLVLAEVLPGFRADRDFRKARDLLLSLHVVNMLDTTIALKSAANFRALRKQGLTVRKTVDSIISNYTYCGYRPEICYYLNSQLTIMVTKVGLPKYDLTSVKSAANQLNIEYRGRKVRLDILNLEYELKDVALCLTQLSESDYRKTIHYDDNLPDDEYICNFIKPGNEELAPDRLYIKYCLFEDCMTIELASFHLSRF